jgi:hypothetical protein
MTESRLRRLPAVKQRRLDALMDRNNQGRLTPQERQELHVLVREAEGIALSNARKLARHHRQVTAPQGSESKS